MVSLVAEVSAVDEVIDASYVLVLHSILELPVGVAHSRVIGAVAYTFGELAGIIKGYRDS